MGPSQSENDDSGKDRSDCGDLLVPLDNLSIGVSISAAAREAVGIHKSTKGITALERSVRGDKE